MIHDIHLRRGLVTLRPLTLDDAPRLRAVVDETTWAGNSCPLPASDEAMAAHLGSLIDSATVLAFAVDLDGRFVGRTTLYDIVDGLRCEIGSTIYDRRVWGGVVNPSAKLLLFTLAFDELGMNRVALRCDRRNTRSHAAIARLGATYEGTLRQFRPAADGTLADVDYFSVLRAEWPRVRRGLEARLEGFQSA
ncbi:GNAT family N-acetyltransferase [Acidipropionibacterium timonense]|uniref:GNAT family N-acetyltransferase n=1 Tax=Acidipropionibacterium timonense TaxID=2161818 RepID=UPI0010307550|nr:GNAT family protein [Acidipropionibacterium timonense]